MTVDLANAIAGNLGNDTLVGAGGGGDDSLYGGAAIDRMIGGAGHDSYLIDSAGDVVVELADQGIDTVRSTRAAQALAVKVEHLIGLNAAGQVLTGNVLGNSITGAGGADTTSGGGGNDAIDGGGGIDRTLGGNGDDLFIATAGDVTVEALNQGNDTVLATTGTSWRLATPVEMLLQTGPTLLNGIGNAAGNLVVGNGAINGLYRMGGADSLDGGGGNDVLIGGAGADTLTCGAGADLFRSAAAADSAPALREVILDFTFNAVDGFDRVDLRLIDTDPLLPLDQGFTVIGGAAFGAGGRRSCASSHSRRASNSPRAMWMVTERRIWRWKSTPRKRPSRGGSCCRGGVCRCRAGSSCACSRTQGMIPAGSDASGGMACRRPGNGSNAEHALRRLYAQRMLESGFHRCSGGNRGTRFSEGARCSPLMVRSRSLTSWRSRTARGAAAGRAGRRWRTRPRPGMSPPPR